MVESLYYAQKNFFYHLLNGKEALINEWRNEILILHRFLIKFNCQPFECQSEFKQLVILFD